MTLSYFNNLFYLKIQYHIYICYISVQIKEINFMEGWRQHKDSNLEGQVATYSYYI